MVATIKADTASRVDTDRLPTDNRKATVHHLHPIMRKASMANRADTAVHLSRVVSTMDNNHSTAKINMGNNSNMASNSTDSNNTGKISTDSNSSSSSSSTTPIKVVHGVKAHHHLATQQTHTATTATQQIQTTHKKASAVS